MESPNAQQKRIDLQVVRMVSNSKGEKLERVNNENRLSCDRVFTDDKILVYALFVASVSENKNLVVNPEYLRQYFSTFGKIENLKYYETYHREKGDQQIYLIEFKNPESAHKILRKSKFHEIAKTRFYVKPADSYLQPYQIRMVPFERISNIEMENYSIFALNEDCLYHVFEFLPFNEQIKLFLISEHFKQMLYLYYKFTKTITIYETNIDGVTQMDIRECLNMIGRNIEKFQLLLDISVFNRNNQGYAEKKYYQFYEFVLEFCPNIRSLTMKNLSFKCKDLSEIISKKLKNLKHFTLYNCVVNDENFKLLEEILERLESLEIHYNIELNGKYFLNMKNLKSLKLIHTKLNSDILLEVLKTSRNLQCLHISDITQHHFENLLQNCSRIEEIDINLCDRNSGLIKLIPKMETLKHLTIQSVCKNLNYENLLKELTKQPEKASQLQSLFLTNCLRSFNLQEEVILDYILRMKNLKNLTLYELNCTPEVWIQLSQLRKLENLVIVCLNKWLNSFEHKNEFLYFLEESRCLKNVHLEIYIEIFSRQLFHDLIEIINLAKQKEIKIRFSIIVLHIFDINLKVDPKYNIYKSVIQVVWN